MVERLELGIVVPVDGIPTYVHPEDMPKFTGATIFYSYLQYKFQTVASKIQYDGLHGDRILVREEGKSPELIFTHWITGITTKPTQ